MTLMLILHNSENYHFGNGKNTFQGRFEQTT